MFYRAGCLEGPWQVLFDRIVMLNHTTFPSVPLVTIPKQSAGSPCELNLMLSKGLTNPFQDISLSTFLMDVLYMASDAS